MFSFTLFRYGLTVPKKKFDGLMKATNVFGDDSDSDNEAIKKPIQVCIHCNSIKQMLFGLFRPCFEHVNEHGVSNYWLISVNK